MKKICVVTWYKSPNYGTQLQSASLCSYLKEKGFDVYILHSFKVKEYLIQHPSLLISRIKMKLNTKKKQKFFHPVSYEVTPEQQKNIDKYISDNFKPLDITTMSQWKKIIAEKWIFITGSDIIWQPALGSPNKMFLDFAMFENLTRIAYASSTGAKKLPEKYYKNYKKLLKGFHAISTREQNSADFFSELLCRKVYKVCMIRIFGIISLQKLNLEILQAKNIFFAILLWKTKDIGVMSKKQPICIKILK